jgi:hypothetical protein
MSQTALDFANPLGTANAVPIATPRPAPAGQARASALPAQWALPGDTLCATGYQLGRDHAHHGLVPPAELLLPGTPVAQGWAAGKAVFGQRTLPSTPAVRLWLQLRTLAWRKGLPYDDWQVTPHYLSQLHTERCPVLRVPLGGGTQGDMAPVVVRLNPQAGYAAGNLATISLAAERARQGLGLRELVRRARQAELCGPDHYGLPAAAWWRLAMLQACSLPAPTLPHHEAARLPMAMLPPNRVRVLSPVLGLQALVTHMFMRPGWADRARHLGACLLYTSPSPRDH